jgi:uncharacterized protein DUF4242
LEDDVRPFRSWFVCNSEPETKEDTMPRYLVERSFPKGLSIPVDEGGAKTCQVVVDGNATEGVTWIQSYVTTDKQMTFCVYDGPSPEAIRRYRRLGTTAAPGDIGRRRLASCQAAVRSHGALEATA